MTNNTILENSQTGAKLVTHDAEQNDYLPYYKEFPTYIKNKSQAGEFSDPTKYPIFAYIFNKARLTILKDSELIPFDRVIERMRRYSRPLCSDFYEETRCLPGLRKQMKFFEYAFYTGELWTGFDMEEEIYRFFVKTTYDPKDEETNLKFLDIETNEVEIFPNPSELVLFNGDGSDDNRFSQGFYLAYQMEVKLSIYHRQCHLFNKRLSFDKEELSAFELENIERDLLNLDVTLTKNRLRNVLKPLENPQSSIELDGYLKSVYSGFDREISEFGRVANLNPKKERKTAGENYIAVDRQTDHLRAVQDQLDVYAGEMEERGGPPLIFKVNTEQSLGLGEVENPEAKEATETEAQ